MRPRYWLSCLRPALALARRIRMCLPGHGRGNLRALIYHDIPPRHVSRFREQMQYINRTYRVLDYAAFCEELEVGSRERRPGVLVTFDDGFASNLFVAETVLKPLGIRAVFFVVPEFVNCRTRDEQEQFIATNMCPGLKGKAIPEHLQPMDWADLRALQSQGHTIGAHTCTHARLSLLTTHAELESEILNAADMIEAELGRKIEAFAYPFGNAASIISEALSIAGHRYRCIFSGVRGNITPSVSRLAIRREAVAPYAPSGYLGFLIEGGLSLYYVGERRQLDYMAAQTGANDWRSSRVMSGFGNIDGENKP